MDWPFYFILFYYFVLFYLFILFYFILAYIARSLTLLLGFIFFIFIFIVLQENWGCLSTLTKARALKEDKQNIFGGKNGSMWLIHMERGDSISSGE